MTHVLCQHAGGGGETIILFLLWYEKEYISKAHDWISSYLKGRRQLVNINGSLSDELTLDCGVPQGSVSGPLYYTSSCRYS